MAQGTTHAFIGKNDRHVMAAVATGELTADPETGHLTYRDRPVGRATAAGYLQVSIRRTGEKGFVTVAAHRAAWMCYHGRIMYGLVVNHRNGQRWDNRRQNLELVTPHDNMRHANGLPYAAIGESEDGNSVSPEWYAEAIKADEDDASDLTHLKPERTHTPQPYAMTSVSRPRSHSRIP